MTSGGFSIKFSKSSGQKLATTSKIVHRDDDDNDDGEENPKKQIKINKITSLDVSGFKIVDEADGDAKNSKKDLVIPAIPNKLVFNQPQRQDEPAQNEDDRLNQLARKALLEDIVKLENGDTLYSDLVISGKIDNRDKQRLDLADLADEAAEADYESVPVESYGKALLRGLGWREGQPIGRRVTKTVIPVVTAPRPKGLGLGAAVPKPQQQNGAAASSSDKAAQAVELTHKPGAYFKTVNKSEYGEIIGMDEDNARVIVRMTLSKATVSLSQHAVRLVEKIEYEKFSKVLNKQKFDEYKKSDEDVVVEAVVKVSEKLYSNNKSDKEPNRKSTNMNSNSSWLFPRLRVRVIDKSYRKGRFYKDKVRIVDVTSSRVCNCVTDDGRLLEDLNENQLETVVPKRSGDTVRVVSPGSKYRNQFGTFLDKDSKRCKASVKLDDGTVCTLNYDDICEYVDD